MAGSQVPSGLCLVADVLFLFYCFCFCREKEIKKEIKKKKSENPIERRPDKGRSVWESSFSPRFINFVCFWVGVVEKVKTLGKGFELVCRLESVKDLPPVGHDR